MQSTFYLLQWISVGILFGISFLHPYFWWCYIPAVVLFLFLTIKEKSYKKLFIYGLLVGTYHAIGAMFWAFYTVPVMLFYDSPVWLQYSIVTAYLLSFALILGVSMGFFTMFVHRYARFLFLFPVAWVGYELLRAFLYSLFSLGAGGYVNTNFSFGDLGYLLAQNDFMLGFATFGGVYVLSGIAASIGLFFYFSFSRKRYYSLAIGLLLLLCSFFVPSPFLHTPASLDISVISVGTHFNSHFYKNTNDSFGVKTHAIKKAVERAMKENPDTILLPEGASLTGAFANEEEIFEWASDSGAIIVDSMRTEDNENVYMRAYIYDTLHAKRYLIDKQYLVPLGEVAPFMQKHLISKFYTKDAQKDLLRQYSFSKGVLTDGTEHPSTLPAILFCFESVSPTGVRDAVQYRNPPYVVHVVSHSWFYNAFSLEYALDAMLRVQSVWQGVPVVTAANMSENKLYLPDGTIEEGEMIVSSQMWDLVRFDL